jgi:phage shock protein A
MKDQTKPLELMGHVSAKALEKIATLEAQVDDLKKTLECTRDQRSALEAQVERLKRFFSKSLGRARRS